jgi:hypothetical protein
VREIGKVQLAEVRVEADVVIKTGIEHRTTVMLVQANLEGEDHVEPTVEQSFIRFYVAKAREEALRLADRGDFDGAAASLGAAKAALAACPPSPLVAEEIEDLAEQTARMRARLYEARDRKYQSARAKVSRRRKVRLEPRAVPRRQISQRLRPLSHPG